MGGHCVSRYWRWRIAISDCRFLLLGRHYRIYVRRTSIRTAMTEPQTRRRAMTLQELRYLIALADKGHFVRAAEACHISQSTLSTQLKKLEDYLGVSLFERNKHRLMPTPTGAAIIERARTALDV